MLTNIAEVLNVLVDDETFHIRIWEETSPSHGCTTHDWGVRDKSLQLKSVSYVEDSLINQKNDLSRSLVMETHEIEDEQFDMGAMAAANLAINEEHDEEITLAVQIFEIFNSLPRADSVEKEMGHSPRASMSPTKLSPGASSP
ncbi:hypothetical protein Ancab_029114 [Ancistrocladus abbreviatus]